MQDFANRQVVVTGGAGALGAAVVENILNRGGWCHVPCFNDAEFEAFSFRDHERVRVARSVDLANESSCEQFFASTGELWASIHVAGGFAMRPIEQTSLDDWRRMIDMNATTCFLCCREAVRRMKGRGGRIVNITARPALAPVGGMIPYSASKSAVVSITQSLAEEVKDDAIWVNAVAPSIMDTPANRAAMPKANHDAWPKVEEVAETIVFLASPLNKVTRGGIVPVYGRS